MPRRLSPRTPAWLGVLLALTLLVGFASQAWAVGGDYKPTQVHGAPPAPGPAPPTPAPVVQPDGQQAPPPPPPDQTKPRGKNPYCGPEAGFWQLGAHLSYCRVTLHPGTVHIVSGLAGLLLTIVAVYPIYAYFRRGWFSKRDDIMSSFTPEAQMTYLETFRLVPVKNVTDACQQFTELYKKRYGRYRLVFPLIALLLILFPILFLFVETAIWHLKLASDGKVLSVGLLDGNNLQLPELPAAAAAAIAGAYIWTVLTLVSAANRANMPPGLVLTAAARLVIAAPLGYAVARVAPGSVGPFFAFAFSSFPLEQVQSLTRQLVGKYLNLDVSETQSDDRVTVIDGVDRETAVRLADADITTAPQYAYCDPVQVSMQTNINFDAIVDGQNQALLRLYLGADVVKVRPMGLRGAMEARTLVLQMADTEPAINGPARATFAVAATALGVPPEGLSRALDEIAHDPYTVFLANVWASTTRPATMPASS